MLPTMELTLLHRELRRVGAYLGERCEPGEAVESGVFHTFRHHHARGLLEPSGGRMLGLRQHRNELIDDRRQVGPVTLREVDRFVQALDPQRQIRAVDRETREQLGDRVGGIRASEVAFDSQHLGPQDAVGDAALRIVDELHPRDVVGDSAQFAVEGIERLTACRVDQHPVDLSERVVARGSRGRPRGRQLLIALEDLLDEHVTPPGGGRQRIEISSRIDEAVGMIDAQPIREPRCDPAHYLAMRLVEHPGDFHADAREGVDGEESAVIELGVGAAPIHEFVVLARVHLCGGRSVVGGAGCDRKAVVVVAQFALDDGEVFEFTLVPGSGRSITEHGDAHLAAAELPVDIERVGIARPTPVGEQIPPPHTLDGSCHTDVVGHDVDQHAEPVGARGRGCCRKPIRPPAPGIDARVIGDVVPVVRTLLGPQDGREVDPVGPEFTDVVGHPCRL